MNTIYDIEICDCHHHLWDLQKHYYPWLTDVNGTRVCGKYDAIRNKNFLLEDFFRNRGNLKITRFIHEEAVMDRADTVRETQWLQEIADSEESDGTPHGIVAHADFSRDDIEQIIEEHQSYPNFRGIRQFMHEAYMDPENPQPSLLEDETWQKRIGLCEKFDIVFDMQIYWQQANDAIKTMSRNPRVTFVLPHIGLPAQQQDKTYMAGWRDAMKHYSELPNTNVKLSGFGMFDREWTVESIRPIITDTIEFFGIDRCMFASNFPVDSLCGKSYTEYWELFFEVVKDFTNEEKEKLFSRNARRVYKV